MADKEERILITKVSGNCRNLRIIDEDCEYGSEGLYCAANPHTDWEKITKNTCKKCKREKFLIGISRQEAIEIIKNASEFYLNHKLGCTKEEEAECILNALLGVEK